MQLEFSFTQPFIEIDENSWGFPVRYSYDYELLLDNIRK